MKSLLNKFTQGALTVFAVFGISTATLLLEVANADSNKSESRSEGTRGDAGASDGAGGSCLGR